MILYRFSIFAEPASILLLYFVKEVCSKRR